LNSIILHCHVLPSEDQSFKRKTWPLTWIAGETSQFVYVHSGLLG
jgi:hypothetical protein